jgi:hypothetical protein
MAPIICDITSLDDAHRRALEDLLGRKLKPDERLVIEVTQATAAQVTETTVKVGEGHEPALKYNARLEPWTKFYEGLSDEEIDAIDREINSRADLSRPSPEEQHMLLQASGKRAGWEKPDAAVFDDLKPRERNRD